MDAALQLGQLAEWLQLEKAEEERRLAAILRERSVKERRASGLCWHPVKPLGDRFAFGGQPVVEVGRDRGEHPAHEMYKGTPVFLYSTQDEGERYKGTVASLQEHQMEIALHGEEIPEGFRENEWGVEVRFDDKTFFEMERALNVAINMDSGEKRTLRDRILGHKPLGEPEAPATAPNVSSQLNASQKEAVKGILQSPDVLAIHGPPGTGKTTTLSEAIRLLAADGKKVLVCAPSNTAVDHLTMKLNAAGVNAVRVGRLGRMDQDVFPNALEVLLEEAQEMKSVKSLRKRANDAEKEAERYRRNFGAAEREERKAARKAVRELRTEARELERYAEQRILESAQALTCTLVGASDVRLRKHQFDVVVIDEAGQALEPACWIAILKADRVVLAGDPLQLPPTVKSADAARKGLSVSLLEKFVARGEATYLLNVQYRMNARIMGFSNEWFYNNALIAHENVASGALRREEKALEFIDTAGCGFEEAKEKEGDSLRNPGEISVVVAHLGNLLESEEDEIRSIGVISPYRAQVEALKPALPEDNRIVVQTVDGFQGQERDVVYISLVRSNESGQLGFLKDYRRMNVAMTRAQRKLVVIGDSSTLGNDSFYEAFLKYCERHDAYHSAWELGVV